MNNNQQQTYTYQQPVPVYQQPPVKQSNGCGAASLTCAIIAFFFNPLSLLPLISIILGIVGLTATGKPKGAATAGLILGIIAAIWQFTFDLVFSLLTLGIGFVVFLF